MTTHIEQIVTFRPKLKIGVGGNYYVISTNKENLEAICVMIKKKRTAVYYQKKYNCWAIRVKDKKQKKKLKDLFEIIVRNKPE